jgi:hypothetical protein
MVDRKFIIRGKISGTVVQGDLKDMPNQFTFMTKE